MARAKKTIEERRAELNAELARLEVAETVQEKAAELIERLNDNIKSLRTDFRVVGHEEQQATKKGELLWNVPRHWQPVGDAELATLSEDERAGATPYYKPIWDDVELPEEELSEYSKKGIDACKFLIKVLEEAEY